MENIDKIPAIPIKMILRLPLVWLIAGIYCVLGGLTLGWGRSSVENGFIENMQLVALFVAVIIFAMAAVKSRSYLRIICLSSAWLLTDFWFREYYAEPGDMAFSRYLGSRAIMKHWVIVLVVCLIVWLSRGGWRMLPALARYGFSWRIWPYIVCGLLLVLGGFFERMGGEWAEESSELLSYCSYIAVAWWYYKAALDQNGAAQHKAP